MDNNKTLIDPMELFDKQNYMLITVVEGSIDHPQFFKSFRTAHDAMCTYMAVQTGKDKAFIKECHLAGEMVDNDAYISDKSAYFENDNHDNVPLITIFSNIKEKKRLEQVLEHFSMEGLRILVMGYKEVSEH